MVLPLYDDNPFTTPGMPVVTWSLITINILVFLLQVGAPDAAVEWMTMSFGFTPAAFAHDAPQAGPLPSALTLLTSMFIHGGWGHLLGNMLYLFIFGDDIEKALGSLRFLVFYLASGVLAALGYFAINVHSSVTLIGASGAVSAILAAYLMLRPCARVTALVLRVIVRVRAYWVIGGWIVRLRTTLPPYPDPVIRRIDHPRTIILPRIRDRRIRQPCMPFANHNDQVRLHSTHHRRKPSPIHQRGLNILLRHLVRPRIFRIDPRPRFNDHRHCPRLQNIGRKDLFLAFRQRSTRHQQTHRHQREHTALHPALLDSAQILRLPIEEGIVAAIRVKRPTESHR
jgi:membrane associated rhomboid family serine protease